MIFIPCSEFDVDDNDDYDKHLEQQQPPIQLQEPPIQQPLAEVNHHQQPVEGLVNEVKEDVDEFKPEDLQMKMDPVGTSGRENNLHI